MRKTHKIINIALIFTLIGVFLCQDLAYSLDIYHLRLPMDIDEERFFSAAEKKKNFSIPIRWTTTRLDYNNMKTEMPYFMKEYIREVVLNTDNGFLEKTIFSCLKKKIKPEEVKKIKGMGIKLFQLGKYNYIFRVNVSLGTKKVTFGLVAAKGSSLNQSTMDDFANILSLRKQFPKFSDLLQNPYVLDNSTSLTMFSCEWFNDYYELGIDWNNAEQTTTFYINDKRIPPRKIREERIDPYMFQFTKEETAAIVEETSRTLTIFFDEERQRSIDLSRIIIEAGDLTHYRKVSKPKLKLMTVRNIKKNQGVNDFITALMNLEDDVTGGLLGLFSFGPAFSNYRESVAKGILRGLQDKHGKEQGKERFSIWCDNCPLLESAAISLTTALSSSPSLSSNRKGFTDSPQSDQSLASNQGVEKGRRKVKGSQAQLGDKGAMHPLQNKASESGDTLYLGMIEYTPKEIEELLDLVGDKTDQKKTFRRA